MPRFLLLALFLFLVPTAQAQELPDSIAARIAAVEQGLRYAIIIEGQPAATMTLAERMAHYRVPGVSIAVINDGRIEWAKAYGVKEGGTTTPVTTETLFQAASISKPVAAVAMLRLVQEGRIHLDENVNAYLRAWQVPENEHTVIESVTPRRLVTHTAGLTVHGFRGYAQGEPVPTPVQVLDGAAPANSAPVRVDTIPGAIWRYSGGGYTVLQQLLEDVTGEPFDALLHRLVLEPAGMTHSTYTQPLPPNRHADAATGHRAPGTHVAGKWHTYPEQAAAGLWTTPADLARFAIALQEAYAGTSETLLSQAMAQQMMEKGLGNMGLGVGMDEAEGVLAFSHGGANEGFRAYWVGLTNGQGAVVMTNSDRGNDLNLEIIRAIAHTYGWPFFQPTERAVVDVPEAVLARYEGTYAGEGVALQVTHEAGQLYVQVFGQPRMALFAASATEFFPLEMNATLTFDADSPRLTLRFGNRVIEAKKQ